MSAERYNHVESRKREGAHYTPEVLADFVAEKIVAHTKQSENINIVDPAVGDGELLISLIRLLQKKSFKNIHVYGFDTNPESVKLAKKRIKQKYPDIRPNILNKDFLQYCIEESGTDGTPGLFKTTNFPQFDILIANPPYIRTQVLGSKQAKLLSKNFGLKGRVDIYQAFLVAMKSVLASTGIAGVIVSNRFLTTKGAGRFREILYEQYAIKGLWDFGDTKVFEAAVLPAVIMLSPAMNKNNAHIPFSSIYEVSDTNSNNSFHSAKNQIEALKHTGLVVANGITYTVRHGHLTFDSNSSDVWRLQDDITEKWLNQVASNTLYQFGEIGKIRVGVKTTADNVFIRKNWKDEVGFEPELLKPLTTHHVAGRYKCNLGEKKSILYTHEVKDGKRCVFDINKYPLSKKYLNKNKSQLAARKYVIDANRKWYEIWVPQNPDLWKEPKIIFRDISEHPMFWYDKDGTVVNGDCYWMINDNKQKPKDILWLILAIANSDFIEEFYDIKFQNKLYANRRRFISQYVEQFPIPDPECKISKDLIALAKICFKTKNQQKYLEAEKKINSLVWKVFQVTHVSDFRD